MKKILSLICVLVLILSCVSCTKKSDEQLYNYEVTAEEFEQLPTIEGNGMYKKYDSESEIYNDSDIVIIGMPINTYTEDEIRFYNTDGQIVDKSAEGFKVGYTARAIKVLEVLKGEDIPAEITVEQMGYTDIAADGTKGIRGISSNEYIAKKNAKYIYYLKHADNKAADVFYAIVDQGVINIDNLDSTAAKKVKEERLEQAKIRFFDKFEKYDRSKELVK